MLYYLIIGHNYDPFPLCFRSAFGASADGEGRGLGRERDVTSEISPSTLLVCMCIYTHMHRTYISICI